MTGDALGAAVPPAAPASPGAWGAWPTAPDAMREVLRAARWLAASGDTEQVLRRAAATACRVLGYRCTAVAWQAQDGAFRYQVLAGGTPEEERDLRSRTVSEAALSALLAAATAIQEVRWVPPRHPVRDIPEVMAATRPTGVTVRGRSWERGSLLLVPVRDGDGRILGFLNPDDPLTGDLPGTSEAVLLGSLAELTALAVETVTARESAARSVALAEAQRGQLEQLLTASVAVRGHGALDEVLGETARAMVTAAGFRRAAVYLLDDDGATLRVRATVGLDPGDEGRMRATPVELAEFRGLMQPEMRVGRSFLLDHRYHQVSTALDEKLSIPEEADDWQDGMWHAEDSLTVPLEDRLGALLGVISVDEPLSRRLPTEGDIRSLEMFADQCALAVAEARRYERAMAEAGSDPLTGLANRRTLLTRAGHLVTEAAWRDEPTSVAFFDLDHFKAINDRFGHAAGDEVITTVATVLSGRLRSGDLLARYGGEEFVALLPATALADAMVIVDELRALLAATRIPAARGAPVRVSAGVAELRPGEAVEQVFARADRALYAAKQAGRNRVQAAH